MTLAVPNRAPFDGPRSMWVLARVAACGACGYLVTSPQASRVVVATAIVLVGLALAFWKPWPALLLAVIWLTALGGTRRALYDVFASGRADPLLLIGPVILVGLVAAVVGSRPAEARSRLAGAVLAFTVLAVLGCLNPAQGTLTVAGSGVLFVVLPTFAFWVGRALLNDDRFRQLLRLVGALAVVVCGYGLFQALIGFPTWDASWIARATSNGYVSLGVGGSMRPFSTFSAAAEYVKYLSVGVVIWVATPPARGPLVRTAVLLVLGVALVLGASRGPVVLTVVAACLIISIRRRRGAISAVAVGAGAVGLLVLALGAIDPSPPPGAATGLIEHQINGLANPLNDQHSTLNAHVSLASGGLVSAFTEPLGSGTGTITLGAAHFGDRRTDTEADLSNAATALGLPGLLAFVWLVVAAFRSAFRVATQDRDNLALAALGILTVTAMAWLDGALYAIAPLAWLTLGWVDRRAAAGASA